MRGIEMVVGMVIVVLALMGQRGVTVGGGEVLRLTVYPHTIFAGQPLRVTCTVFPNKDNRTVGIGVEETRYSEREVNGRKTHELLVENVPCEAGYAFCILTQVNGKTVRAQAPIKVLGCEEAE